METCRGQDFLKLSRGMTTTLMHGTRWGAAQATPDAAFVSAKRSGQLMSCPRFVLRK